MRLIPLSLDFQFVFRVSAALVFFTCALSGCAAGPAPTLIAATSPLPPGVRGTIPTSASDCQYHLLGLIPLSTSSNTQRALEKAKDNAGTSVLTDVTVDKTGAYFILFSNSCSRVRGLGVDPTVLARIEARNQGAAFVGDR